MTNSLKNPIIRLFASFMWVKIKYPPKWIENKTNGYYEYYCNKYGTRPYDKKKIFKGDNYLYKVIYKTLGQGNIQEIFYVKKR